MLPSIPPMRYLFLLLVIVSFSCTDGSTESDERKGYIERQLSFFNPLEPMWQDGENQGFIYEQWIRKPGNIRMINETLKKIGYRKLINQEDRFSTINSYGILIRKPMNELLDSLILTYKQDTIFSTYYREFWNRRKSENNQEIVYEILTDLTSELYEDNSTKPNEDLVNDTLYNLVVMKELSDTITLDLAREHFDYLTNIGMHQSAYNLLFESYRYSHLNWNRDKLLERLTVDSINCCREPWIIDDTK